MPCFVAVSPVKATHNSVPQICSVAGVGGSIVTWWKHYPISLGYFFIQFSTIKFFTLFTHKWLIVSHAFFPLALTLACPAPSLYVGLSLYALCWVSKKKKYDMHVEFFFSFLNNSLDTCGRGLLWMWELFESPKTKLVLVANLMNLQA